MKNRVKLEQIKTDPITFVASVAKGKSLLYTNIGIIKKIEGGWEVIDKSGKCTEIMTNDLNIAVNRLLIIEK